MFDFAVWLPYSAFTAIQAPCPAARYSEPRDLGRVINEAWDPFLSHLERLNPALNSLKAHSMGCLQPPSRLGRGLISQPIDWKLTSAWLSEVLGGARPTHLIRPTFSEWVLMRQDWEGAGP